MMASMFYQRPLFATFALLYCVALGAISIYSNPRSKIHRLFALYNLSLGLYNAADYALLMSNHTIALWYTRIVSIGGAFMIYFFLYFVYELAEVAQSASGKRTIKMARTLAAVFAVLYLTPLMIKGINMTDPNLSGLEIPGPLYFFYGALSISGLIAAVMPLGLQYKTASEIQKKKITYIFAACSAGIVAISLYFLSLIGKDLPWLYYSFEALVGFILIYAIFQFNLISITLALRRALLVLGIYIGLAMVIIPLTLFYHTDLMTADISTLVIWIMACGLILSLGPIIYAHTVRHVSLFQDKTISHLTHELKTPLGAIQSAKMLLEEELAAPQPRDKKVRDYLDIIQRNSDRLEKFVLDILNHQKSGMGSKSEQKEHFDAGVLAAECAQLLPEGEKRCCITLSGDPTILAVKEGVRQIFLNLISNALKYDAKGTVEIELKREANTLRGRVSDHGPGISKEALPHLFDPFSAFHRDKTSTKSTGLGLAIAKRWVDLHGGRIWAESTPQGGASFNFTLPVA